MDINKGKLVYIKNKSSYNSNVFLDTQVIFVEDTKEIITHGISFAGIPSSYNMYVGAKDKKANASTENGNTYIKLYKDSTLNNQFLIKGTGATTVVSDASGNITINSTDNNTWRALQVKGTQIAGTGTSTYPINFAEGTDITLTGTAGTSTTKLNSITINHASISTTVTAAKDTATQLAYSGEITVPTAITTNNGHITAYTWTKYKLPAASHYTTHIYTGASGATANSTSDVSNPYLTVVDDTTYRNQVQFKGGGKTTIKANGGIITISSTDTWNAFVGATSSKAGTAGYVPAPSSGQTGLYFRSDGTWATPPGTYSLPTASNTTLGGVKTGAAITDISGYTAVHIKDGVIYYKNTTYSTRALKINGNTYNVYTSNASLPTIYAPTAVGTAGQVLATNSNADGLEWKSVATTTKSMKVNGANYSIYTTGASLPTIYAPTALGTAGQVLKVNSDGTALIWATDATITNTWRPVQALKSDGTSLGTLNDSTSTVKFKAGSNITLAYSSGTITITGVGDTWTALKGATALADGTAGYAPKPTKGQQGYYLKGNATWVKPSLSEFTDDVVSGNYLLLSGGTMDTNASIIMKSNVTSGPYTGSSSWKIFAYSTSLQFKYDTLNGTSFSGGGITFNTNGNVGIPGDLISDGSLFQLKGTSTIPTKIKNFASGEISYTTIGSEERPLIINNNDGSISIWKGENNRQVSLASYGSVVFTTTTTGGWAMGSKIAANDKSWDKWISGALGDANTLTYYYYGGAYNNPLMVILPGGNVGIGTKTPSHLLHVNGNLGIGNIYSTYYSLIGTSTNPYLKFISGSTNWYAQVYNKLLWLGSGATYYTGVSVDSGGGFTCRSCTVIDSNQLNTSYKSRWSFYGWDDTLAITKRKLDDNGYISNVITVLYNSGNVGIGTNTPLDKLHVNGGILSTATVRGTTFTSTGVGSGTYNVGAISTNTTCGLEIEAPLKADSYGHGETYPITFSWRGGYANRYGMQLFGGGANAYLTLTSSKTSIKFFAWDDGCTYIESGNTAFTANANLNITGIGGNTGSDLWLNMATIYCRGGKYVNIDSGNWSSYISTSASLSWPIKSPTRDLRHTEIGTGGDLVCVLDGATGFANGISAKNSAGVSYGTAAGLLGNNTSLDYYYYGGTYDSPKAVILPNGNMGIGDKNPAYKLEVAGSLKSGSIYFMNGDSAQSVSYMFGMYQWGNEVQFTKRNLSNVHQGTCMGIDLTSGVVNFDYGIKIGGKTLTFVT